MSKRTINAVVWAGVLAVVAGLWFFSARTRLHLVDPLSFITVVAVAAAVLTALLWWEMRKNAEDPAPEGASPPADAPRLD